jgi:hypothetical protein
MKIVKLNHIYRLRCIDIDAKLYTIAECAYWDAEGMQHKISFKMETHVIVLINTLGATR